VSADTYRSYLQMRQWLPRRVWHAARAVALAGAFSLVATLFVSPRIGLIAWWLFVLPCLPALMMLAPGVWRNLCPMATLNQLPRLFGFSRSLVVPGWLRRQTILIQAVLYFALISMRAPVLDHYGWTIGVLMLVALGAAFLGGVIFKGKSGWCGTFCPLMPIQRLYGQTPVLVVPNSHCSTCVGCTSNCIDFHPRLAVVTDVRESDPYRLGQLKFFAGAFPGFVVAFFTVPNSVIGGPADIGVSLGRYYLLTLVYMLVSLGCFFVLDALVPVTELVLMAAFGALGLGLHNFLRFSTAFSFHKPLWLVVIENAAVVAITTQFVVRTYRLERDVAGRLAGEQPSTVIRPRTHGDPNGSSATDGHEVSFARNGPRVVVPTGTTLLEAAERSDLQVESGCRMGVCGADPVAVVAGGDQLSPPSPGERSTLERLGLGEDCRMACVARVRGDVEATFDLTAAAPAAPVRMEVDYDRDVARVIIIGNGIAGNTAADHIRRRHPDCTVDIIGEELHPTYNRMGIARLVYGRSAMSGLQLFTDEWYERNRVTLWLNTLVSEIDRPRREVVLGTGERLPYDRLILTTGAAASVPPIEGLHRPAVFVMRSADDAVGIRAYAQRHRCRRAIVVGGGLLGLEAAHALHTFGTRPTVVQRSARLLVGQFDERAAGLVERYLTGLGVHLVLGVTPVAVVEQDGGLALSLSDGSAMATDMVVLCTGIRPNTELAVAAGLEVDRGVVVDDGMKTSDPTIYAAGDIVQYRSDVPGLWPIAVAQAEVAAANVAGDRKTYEPRPQVTILKGIGLSATAVGEVDGRTGDDILVREPPPDEVRYLKLVIRHGILVGAMLLGDWTEATSIVDAVASGRDVSAMLPTLRAGDMSPLGEPA
jgi:NADPH-dependent 2,4-dienoyl-CoA reductase/sulfur reductase-like enzyme/ferredoxin